MGGTGGGADCAGDGLVAGRRGEPELGDRWAGGAGAGCEDARQGLRGVGGAGAIDAWLAELQWEPSDVDAAGFQREYRNDGCRGQVRIFEGLLARGDRGVGHDQRVANRVDERGAKWISDRR